MILDTNARCTDTICSLMLKLIDATYGEFPRTIHMYVLVGITYPFVALIIALIEMRFRQYAIYGVL